MPPPGRLPAYQQVHSILEPVAQSQNRANGVVDVAAAKFCIEASCFEAPFEKLRVSVAAGADHAMHRCAMAPMTT